METREKMVMTDTKNRANSGRTQAVTQKAMLAGMLLFVALLCWAGTPRQLQAGEIDLKEAMADRVLGDPLAPVLMTEYSSLTCPHCATFHTEILPRLKEEFIDTGKVRLLYRDFPLDGVAMRGALLARCANPKRYFGFLDTLFREQRNWTRATDIPGALRQIARRGGIADERFDECMNNRDLLKALAESKFASANEAKISVTPTFVFNNGADRIEGALPIEKFREVIHRLLMAQGINPSHSSVGAEEIGGTPPARAQSNAGDGSPTITSGGGDTTEGLGGRLPLGNPSPVEGNNASIPGNVSGGK
jgi:protein-disulfide isomerase